MLGLGDSVGALSRIVGPLVGMPLYHVLAVGPLYLGAILMSFGVVLVRMAVSGGQDFQKQQPAEAAADGDA